MTKTSNTTQRDELVREIFITDNARSQDPAALWDEADHERMHYAEVIADGLIAKGYRKPRTITTVEELDGLPAWSVVRSEQATIWEKFDGSPGGDFWAETMTLGQHPSGHIALPATVLHEPEAEATR